MPYRWGRSPPIQLQRQGNGDMTEVLKNLVPSFNATALTGDGVASVVPNLARRRHLYFREPISVNLFPVRKALVLL
jgi:hypothetical protein